MLTTIQQGEIATVYQITIVNYGPPMVTTIIKPSLLTIIKSSINHGHWPSLIIVKTTITTIKPRFLRLRFDISSLRSTSNSESVSSLIVPRPEHGGPGAHWWPVARLMMLYHAWSWLPALTIYRPATNCQLLPALISHCQLSASYCQLSNSQCQSVYVAMELPALLVETTATSGGQYPPAHPGYHVAPRSHATATRERQHPHRDLATQRVARGLHLPSSRKWMATHQAVAGSKPFSPQCPWLII